MALVERYIDYNAGDDTTGDGLAHGTAWKTIQKALDSTTLNATDGNRFNLSDAAEHVLTATLSFATIGEPASAAGGIRFEGYSSTAGDGGVAPIDCGGFTCISSASLDYTSYIRLTLTNWGSSYCFITDNFNFWYECELDGEGTRQYGINGDVGLFVYRCKLHSFHPTSVGILIQGRSSCYCFDNYLVATNIGMDEDNGVKIVIGNTVILDTPTNNASYGIGTNATSIVSGNTVIRLGGSATGCTGIYGVTAGVYMQERNYVEGFSASGDAVTDIGSSSVFLQYGSNKYYNNTAIIRNGTILSDDGNNATLGSSGVDANYLPTSDLQNAGLPSQFWQTAATPTYLGVGAAIAEQGATTTIITRPRRTM
jgi:hypothetical protein